MSSDIDDVAISSAEASPLDLVMRSELVERVRAALDALPPRYPVSIHLYHLDGLSHAKIAATLDVPVATVEVRARRKVTPLLAEYAPDAAPYVNEVFEERP